jgi:hypothetical protein
MVALLALAAKYPTFFPMFAMLAHGRNHCGPSIGVHISNSVLMSNANAATMRQRLGLLSAVPR